MNFNKLIEQLQKLINETKNASFKKSLERAISLLKQIDDKDLSDEEKIEIQTQVGLHLGTIQNPEDLKKRLKQLREILTGSFGFVPSNYFLSLGIGIGLAIGTSLGISIGVSFYNGIVFGSMIGSGIGLIGGIIFGTYLDKKKESENKVLNDL